MAGNVQIQSPDACTKKYASVPSAADSGDGVETPQDADDEQDEEADEQHEADDAGLEQDVERQRVGPDRRLDAATLLQVERPEAASADTGHRMVGEAGEADAPEVVAVGAEAEQVAASRLGRRQLLEALPFLRDEVARVVDVPGDHDDADTGRERRAGNHRDRCDPARAGRHGQPVVEQGVDESHRDAGHEERERDPTRMPRRRVGAVGPEGGRQPVVLRSDERDRRQHWNEQPQPPRNGREDHHGGDDDRDPGALALRTEPAGEHGRGETERERADGGVAAAVRGKDERGPEPDEEERALGVDVRHGGRQPTVRVEFAWIGAESCGERDRNGARTEREGHSGEGNSTAFRSLRR